MTVRRHVVITGPMGSGKTRLGRSLAMRLDWPFRDSDAVIEAETGITGREVSERFGVEHLHSLERKFLRNALAEQTPVVVAAAASIADDAGLLSAVGETTVAFYILEIDPDRLKDAAATGEHRRPISEVEARRLQRSRSHAAMMAGATAVTIGRAGPDETARRLAAAIPRWSS